MKGKVLADSITFGTTGLNVSHRRSALDQPDMMNGDRRRRPQESISTHPMLKTFEIRTVAVRIWLWNLARAAPVYWKNMITAGVLQKKQ